MNKRTVGIAVIRNPVSQGKCRVEFRSSIRAYALIAPLVFLLLSAYPAQLAFSAEGEKWSRDDAAHLLRRVAFGATPQQIDNLFALGKTGAVEYLLTGKLPEQAKPVFEHFELKSFQASEPVGDLLKRMQQVREETQRLRIWWIDRMCRSDRPLEENMALFWHGIFCSGVREVKNGKFMAEQNALFHSQALGNYKKLAQTILHDPAMLRYLNADQNVRGKPNENLARELMELFTMGEGRGYTEKDIAEVARALTGLRVNGDRVIFQKFLHDDRPKTIFGQTGNYGPDDVVNLIFNRPQPAEYLARRLWTYFASPDPTEADLRPIIAALHQSNYEIRPAVRALFTSDSFYGEKCKFSLIRSPVDMVVGTARTLGLTPSESTIQLLVESMDRMGQQLFQPPNVRGWPGGEQWITSATLYTRYNTATALVNIGFFASTVDPVKLFPSLPPEPTPSQLVDAAVDRFLQRPFNAEKKLALVTELGDGPLRLGDRDAEKRTRKMLGLLLSTPEYQVE